MDGACLSDRVAPVGKLWVLHRTDNGSPAIRWEGLAGTGLVAGLTNRGIVDWLAADARYGARAVTLSMRLQSLHVGRW